MSEVKVRFAKLKPSKLSDAAWGYLVEAWENGLSDREAAFYVSKHAECEEITAEDIQRWFKENPEVKELKVNLHTDLLSEAKITVADSLKERDIKTAKWYLERKGADEFSTKQAVAFEGAVIELSLEEKEKKLKEMVDKFDGE